MASSVQYRRLERRGGLSHRAIDFDENHPIENQPYPVEDSWISAHAADGAKHLDFGE